MNFNMVVMNINELPVPVPGSIHPFLQENYAWVDECLREKYYNNFNNSFLSNKYDDYDLVLENSIPLLKPTPITWANYKSSAILKCIEDEEEDNNSTHKNRKRAESDISNYEVNVGKVILNAHSNSLLDNMYIEELDFEEVFKTNSSQESEESYYSYDSY